MMNIGIGNARDCLVEDYVRGQVDYFKYLVTYLALDGSMTFEIEEH